MSPIAARSCGLCRRCVFVCDGIPTHLRLRPVNGMQGVDVSKAMLCFISAPLLTEGFGRKLLKVRGSAEVKLVGIQA